MCSGFSGEEAPRLKVDAKLEVSLAHHNIAPVWCNWLRDVRGYHPILSPLLNREVYELMNQQMSENGDFRIALVDKDERERISRQLLGGFEQDHQRETSDICCLCLYLHSFAMMLGNRSWMGSMCKSLERCVYESCCS